VIWKHRGSCIYASGRKNTYLIQADEAAVFLTRWDRPAALYPHVVLAVAQQAAANKIETILQRGPGRPPVQVELDAAVAHLAMLAEHYEDGYPLPDYRWREPDPVPVSDAAVQAEAHADAAGRLAWVTDALAQDATPEVRKAQLARALAEVGADLDAEEFRQLIGDVRQSRPWIAPVETGQPWRSAAEKDWDESR
jgi:hypothetical protein